MSLVDEPMAVDASAFTADISRESASQAFYGVSWSPEKRGESSRNEYAATLAEDYSNLLEQAKRGGTLDLLPAEFARYRAGYRQRTLDYLRSSARCVSSWIAGPSNFPARRMNKRADIAHKRLNDLIDFRARALAAIKRTLRPDLSAIYAGDDNALERLEAKIASLEKLQARMKEANAAIRSAKKNGHEAQIQALLECGFRLSQAQQLLMPDFCGRIGFADFQLSNNGANIRRLKQRHETITANKAITDTVEESSETGIRIEDCPGENRIKLFFPGKPSAEVRGQLKSSGFRWAPTEGAWKAYRHEHTLTIARKVAGVDKSS